MQQDEAFADQVLQRISVLLYASLQAAIKLAPELQEMIPALPSVAGAFLLRTENQPLRQASWNAGVSMGVPKGFGDVLASPSL